MAEPDQPRKMLSSFGLTMRAAYKAARTIPNIEVVKAGELVEAHFAQGASPSTAARKLLALLIHHAAGDAWKPGPHSLPRSDLRRSCNTGDRLKATLDELQAILVRTKTIAPDGREAFLTIPLITYRIEHLEDEDKARIWWEFSEQARKMMRDSTYFASMNLGILMSFDSQYAVTLYELGCLLVGRRYPCWRGSVEELRERMGVPGAAYRDWTGIRQKVLEPACAEVTHIAPFDASFRTILGPRNKVLEVELCFKRKDEHAREAADRELAASRVGRKARRKGSTETVIMSSPSLTLRSEPDEKTRA